MEPVKKDLILRGEQIYLRPITADDTELAVRWRKFLIPQTHHPKRP